MLIRDREVSGLDVQNGVFNFMMWLWVTRETNKKKRRKKKLHKMWLGAMGLQPLPDGQSSSEVVSEQG